MNILKFTAKTIAVAGVVVTLAAAPSFALYSECVGEGTDYPELSTTKSENYPIKCVTVTDGDTTVTFYGKRSSDCAKAGTIAANPSLCDDEETITEGVNDEDEAEDEELVEEEDEEEGEEEAEKETSKQEDAKKTESKKDDPTMMIVIIAVAAIAVILLIVLFIVLSKKKGNKDSDTPEAPVAPTENAEPTTPVETEAQATEESTTPANELEASAVETETSTAEPEAPVAETKTAESETPVATETPVETPAEPELVDPFAQTESTVDPNKTNE